jgi:hypothetical protein
MEYFVNTWHKIMHDVKEYSTTCLRMKNKNGWKIKIDEQKKG